MTRLFGLVDKFLYITDEHSIVFSFTIFNRTSLFLIQLYIYFSGPYRKAQKIFSILTFILISHYPPTLSELTSYETKSELTHLGLRVSKFFIINTKKA